MSAASLAGRTGELVTRATARAADLPPPAADPTAGTVAPAPAPGGEGNGEAATATPSSGGLMSVVGAGFAAMTAMEQALSGPIAAIPFPAFPALRITDTDVGLPHGHMHPPNLTPPNPAPIFLPSTGPVIPIPYVSGASTVLINGVPAGRCGDMGLGIFCGGFFPMFEVFLGSSSVWLEGARASRLGVDITKHCIFSAPKPSDPPCGPMTGTTVTGSPNVLIGGAPMPSLTSLAIGAGFKAMFRGLAKVAGKIKNLSKSFGKASNAADGEVKKLFNDEVTRVYSPARPKVNVREQYVKAYLRVEDLVRNGKLMLGGDKAFQEAVEKDLRKIAMTETGQKVLADIEKSPHRVYIEPPRRGRKGNSCKPHSDDVFTPGKGDDSTVRYDPNPAGRPPGSPPDAGLMHELGHARNNALGENARLHTTPRGFDQGRWSNMEEFRNINDVDNAYRSEWGLPPRKGHNHMP